MIIAKIIIIIIIIIVIIIIFIYIAPNPQTVPSVSQYFNNIYLIYKLMSLRGSLYLRGPRTFHIAQCNNLGQ